MREFTAVLGGFEAEMTVGERIAVAQVAAELVLLLESHPPVLGPDDLPQDAAMPRFSTVALAPPGDPVLARLLPEAAPTEPDVSIEFRRLTQQDLVASKVERLTGLIHVLLGDFDALDPESATDREHDRSFELLVTREDAREFAGALTDLRLALSERLGVKTDADSEHLHDNVVAGWQEAQVLDDDAQYLGSIFLLAGILQESLLTEMLAELRGYRMPEPPDIEA